MKKAKLIIALFFITGFITKAQTIRYFEFGTTCGHGNWQDTSFIASTTNQTLIDSVFANINRPKSLRKHIHGAIDYGNAGHNRNASHWFLWHFIPNQWDLVDVSVEVCDGCPYSDVDADTAYWVGNIKEYCSWAGVPLREVAAPLGFTERDFEKEIIFLPNPTRGIFQLRGFKFAENSILEVYNILGEKINQLEAINSKLEIDLSNQANGVYFIKMYIGQIILTKKVIKQ